MLAQGRGRDYIDDFLSATWTTNLPPDEWAYLPDPARRWGGRLTLIYMPLWD